MVYLRGEGNQSGVSQVQLVHMFQAWLPGMSVSTGKQTLMVIILESKWLRNIRFDPQKNIPLHELSNASFKRVTYYFEFLHLN